MRTVQLSAWIPALLLSLSVQAAEWSATPDISLSTSYNDNIRLDAGSTDAVLETAVTPSVNFGVATGNKGIFGNAYASVRRFSGGSGRNSSSSLDREDYRFDTRAYYRTQRNEYGGTLRFARDSTLDSQLDQTGQVISSRATRESFSLGPTWTGVLTEKTRLNLGYNFTTVSYPDSTDGAGRQTLIEYDYTQLSASLTHQYTRRLQGTLAATYSSYQPDSGFDSDTINLQAGIARNFSETLSTSWLAGYRETTSDTLTAAGFCVGANPGAKFPACQGGVPVQTGTTKDSSTDTGSVFSANITKLLKSGSLSADLSRSSNPSSTGGLLDTTRLTLKGIHRFSSRLTSDLSLQYSNAESISRISDNIEVTDQDFFRVRPSLTWRWHRELQLIAGYEYTRSDNRNLQTTSSNAVFLTLNYRPTRFSISR